MIMKSLALASLALIGFSVVGCASLASKLNVGSTSANTSIASVAAKIDAGLAVFASDIPALCMLGANAEAVGISIASVSASASLAKANAGIAAAVASPLCTQGLTGTVADAQTLAATIKSVSAATKGSAAVLAAGA